MLYAILYSICYTIQFMLYYTVYAILYSIWYTIHYMLNYTLYAIQLDFTNLRTQIIVNDHKNWKRYKAIS